MGGGGGGVGGKFCPFRAGLMGADGRRGEGGLRELLKCLWGICMYVHTYVCMYICIRVNVVRAVQMFCVSP